MIFNIHKDGLAIVLSWATFSLIFSIFANSYFIIATILIFFLLCNFFRDPERIIPNEENIIVAPADGKILEISDSKAPKDFEFSEDLNMIHIVIFLNIFDVHVNRIPISGDIKKKYYQVGKMRNSWLAGATKCDDCERQSILINHKNKLNCIVVQIAGMLARKIICDVNLGDSVKTGQKYGIICLGSRTDIYIQKTDNMKLNVKAGDRVVGGETILANL